MAGMNKGLQKHTVKKKLRNRGINPEKIDLEAELDSSLTLPENIENLERKYGRLEREERDYRARMEGARGRRQNYAKREAREIHEERSEYEQYVDETKDAETTYSDPSERQFEKWREHPNKYDIEGVDTRKPAEERPQTKLPIQREKKKYLYKGTAGDIEKIHRSRPVDFREEIASEREKLDLRPKTEGVPEIAVSDSAIYGNKAYNDQQKDKKRVKNKVEMVQFEKEAREEKVTGNTDSSEPVIFETDKNEELSEAF